MTRFYISCFCYSVCKCRYLIIQFYYLWFLSFSGNSRVEALFLFIVYGALCQTPDSRSYPIRPRVKIPKYDCNNEIHNAISELSKEAHNVYYDEKRISEIKNEISRLYLLVV